MYQLKKGTQELQSSGGGKSKRILRLFLNKIKAPTKLNGETLIYSHCETKEYDDS